MNSKINQSLLEGLKKRKNQFLYPYLQVNNELADFCSNAYLSFTRFAAAGNCGYL